MINSGEHVQNLFGVLGAYTSHNLIYNGFGLASYLLCSFFFVLGINLLFAKKVFSLSRNLKYVIVGLLVFSVTFTFFTPGSSFSWGGAVGEFLEEWLEKLIGRFGTGAILVLAALSYIIWRFNPVFKLPNWKPKEKYINKGVEIINKEPEENDEDDDIMHTEPFFVQGDNAVLKIDDTFNNKLKNEGAAITVIMPKQKEEEPNPLHEFSLTEKQLPTENAIEHNIQEEDIELVKKPTPTSKPLATNANNIASLSLEIKETAQDEFTEPQLTTHDSPITPHDSLLTTEDVQNDIQDDTQLEIRSEELATINYDPTLDLRDYKFPTLDLLETHGSEKIVHDPSELEANKTQIIKTLQNYDIEIQRIAATVGPTVTLYEIVPAPGVRISRIKNLEDDIALSLAALGIRIIAPIPGKGTIGIEVPNVRKSVVSMKTLLASDKFQNNNFSLPIAIGKRIDNENFIVDLAAMPHLLMAGATGQGKSVGINTLLVSLLYKKHPSHLKFVLVDPKKVELSLYRIIEKHFLAKLPGEEESIITDTKKVVYTLNALCIEMDNRYDLLKEAGCRNIKEYNEKFTKRRLNPQKGHQFLPFIVLVIDEFADLIMTAGKEIEMPIARLAQLARAVGIHLIIATQRPSVNIITGTIKANFPARIAFKVSSKIDSRTILDVGGAEQLIGKGDMLISYNGEVTRLQCAFVDTPEVDKVCDFIGNQRGYPQAFMLPEYVDEKEMEGKDFDLTDRDPLFDEAARLIVVNQMGSTSLIQRRMKLGYNRAGRLMDQLENAGIVGPNLGSKSREVNIKTEADLNDILNSI